MSQVAKLKPSLTTEHLLILTPIGKESRYLCRLTGIRASFGILVLLHGRLVFVPAKAYATSSTLTDNGLEHFQFTDGVNVLSLSRIWQSENQIKARNLSPYIGVGGGVNLPYVEIIRQLPHQ